MRDDVQQVVRLQAPPRYEQWPVALRSAMQLRGALVACGPGVRGVAWPDSQSIRLASLRPWLTEQLIATHLTAAWVWGAARHPGRPLAFASLAGHRLKLPPSAMVRRYELRLKPDDVVRIGGLQVTSRLRTIVDLLHRPGEFTCAERTACQLLMWRLPGRAVRVRQQLETHRRPHSRLARSRFVAIHDSTETAE